MRTIHVEEEQPPIRQMSDDILQAAPRVREMMKDSHAQNHIEATKIGRRVHEIGALKLNVLNALFFCCRARDGKRTLTHIDCEECRVMEHSGCLEQPVSGACACVKNSLSTQVVSGFP